MLSENELALIQAWCEKRPLRMCVLFGSQATGITHPDSDVDLAIWPNAPLTPEQKLQWIIDLSLLLDNEVSLIIVSPNLHPTLGFEIVKNGRLLFQRDSELWLKERSRLWHLYNDSLLFRRAARQQLKQFAKEFQHGI
jgi:predicted nucleotidyltransferase